MQRATRTLSTALPTLRTRTRTVASSPALLSSILAAPQRSFTAAPARRDASPSAPEPAHEAAPPKLAYFVPRTAHGELPVYTDYKNGGSRVLTIVRKAQGNVEALRSDLAEYLTAPSLTKPAQGQVVFVGDWVRETKEWLAARGF
ncbi:hypothetical protein JCM3775_002117 [Rhodotorula graminis]|uniref:Large ribosomal subunit protein mL49 n=1 Tax=Rhodotorula graminis (strain WP1) TaxID=578459 RepID=A0A194S8F8_RHOGW|nr:uncharacterized protein RHOBADRAFT_41969 [Rhodotorula graminis WP1]KPV76760.1 hypothetical protein RHOBADRAFT_41969 [Rhodotorula graminis WP1]